MLKCVTYTGRIGHRGTIYPGQHPAIIDTDTFARVQALLAANSHQRRSRSNAACPSLLAGKLVDEAGEPMVATHASRGTARYRYYVSRALHHGAATTGARMPAREIEKLVAEHVAQAFEDPLQLLATAWLDVPADRLSDLHLNCQHTATRLRKHEHALTTAIVAQARVEASCVHIDCDARAIASALGVAQHENAPATISITAEVRLARSGMALRLVQRDGASVSAEPDRSLIKQLVAARRWWSELRQGELDITRLAAREQLSPSYITRIVRLAFLAPDVTAAILRGDQRHGVDVRRLTLDAPLPPGWPEQRRLLLAK